MGLLDIILIAIGVSVDAFAVALCKGMAKEEFRLGYAFVVGLYFGGFQAIMPLIGYFAGSAFALYIEAFDHWIAFGLLAIIGLNMIRESFFAECYERTAADISYKTMLPLALATSIDAAAVGVSFALLKINIIISVLLIGTVTFIASAAAVWLGAKCSGKLKKASTLVGGVALISIGIKILIEGLVV